MWKKFNVATIHMVFSSEVCLEADRTVYEELGKILRKKVRLYVPGELLRTKQEDIVILDEADYLLMDELMPVPTCLAVIALSATSYSQADAIEQSFLNKLRFRIIDSKIVISESWN